MVSLYLTKCHRILDHQQVEVLAVHADSTQINMASAESIEQKVSKILMFVISGDQDILKDETYNDYFVISYIWWRYKA